MKKFVAPQIGAATAAQVTAAAAASAVLPTLSGGAFPRYVMLSVEIGKEVFLRPVSFDEGFISPPADSTLMLFTSKQNGTVINTRGMVAIRHKEKTVGATFYMTPLVNA